MVGIDDTFVRARRPEQKQQRREAILAAARTLAADRGVRAVTLGDLADRVGLAKSNVVRYFGTREEIFVELVTIEAQVVRDELVARLDAAGPGAGPDRIAALVAETVTGHELFCELMSQVTTSLEHNVSFEAAERLKLTTTAVAADIAVALRRAEPGLDADSAARFGSATILLVGGLWAGSRPSAVVQEVYAAHPRLVPQVTGVREQVQPLLAALLRGLVHST